MPSASKTLRRCTKLHTVRQHWKNIRVVSAVQEEEKDRHREFVILQVVDCLLNKVHELNGRPCDEVTGVSTEVTHCERRHQLLVCTGGNIGHFDNEIDMAGIEGMEGIKASTKGVNQESGEVSRRFEALDDVSRPLMRNCQAQAVRIGCPRHQAAGS